MPINDHVVLSQDSFRGTYSRGFSDTCPDSFFLDSQNVKFAEGDVLTRDGTVLNLTKGNIVRFFTYKRLGETPRQILLDSTGKFYDSLNLSSAFWTDASATDFSMVNYNNKAYITIHNRVKGIASKSLIVYDGTTARLAAGSPPSGFSITAAISATAGHVELGIHLFAVAYLTDTGFITAPGPATFAQITADGQHKIDLSGVSVGPSGTSQRYILATKAIPASIFTGNQYGYELFFVPSANGGVIANNSGTTASLNFYDADLIDSADYLIDNLSTIPCGVGIGVFNNRLLTWGEDSNQFTIRVSEVGQPEVFSSVTGFINVDPTDAGSGIKNCCDNRNNGILIFTSNRVYTSTDNGSDPNTWALNILDKSVGTECFGIATILDAKGTNTERILVADKSGLINIQGAVNRPELTYNVEDIWKRINKTYFNLIQVVDDPTKHRLLVSIPLDSATAISHILYGDYGQAFTPYGTLDPKAIKWTLWTFPSAPVSIMGDVDTTNNSIIHMALTAGNIYDMKDGLTLDNGTTAIDSYVQTALKTAQFGWINHFGAFKLRIKGSGSLLITLTGEDGSNSTSVTSITLAASPGLEYDRLINFINEKMAIKLRTTSANDYFILTRLDVYAKPLWLRRPA